mgnify:CR=1 FL=1
MNCHHFSIESEEEINKLKQIAKKEMETINEKLKEIPDIRQEKVAKLKKEVKSGRYCIDSRLIAEKIIDQLNQE